MQLLSYFLVLTRFCQLHELLMYKKHSLLIICVMGLSIVFLALFTFYYILLQTLLHCYCFIASDSFQLSAVCYSYSNKTYSHCLGNKICPITSLVLIRSICVCLALPPGGQWKYNFYFRRKSVENLYFYRQCLITCKTAD